MPHFAYSTTSFPLTLTLSLPPSRRASVSVTLRRDRAEAEGEGGKAPLRRDGGREREQRAPRSEGRKVWMVACGE